MCDSFASNVKTIFLKCSISVLFKVKKAVLDPLIHIGSFRSTFLSFEYREIRQKICWKSTTIAFIAMKSNDVLELVPIREEILRQDLGTSKGPWAWLLSKFLTNKPVLLYGNLHHRVQFSFADCWFVWKGKLVALLKFHTLQIVLNGSCQTIYICKMSKY